MSHDQTAQRLRSLAKRMGLDGFADELRAIADELDATEQAQPTGMTVELVRHGTTSGLHILKWENHGLQPGRHHLKLVASDARAHA